MITARLYIPIQDTTKGRERAADTIEGFTLVELLVTLVIISILAGLSLAGLAGARQRAKIDKTRSTIRKIDAIIRPMYDSFRARRVNVSSTTNQRSNATAILTGKRLLLVREMPDSWNDVPDSPPASSVSWYTPTVRSYVAAQSGFRSDYRTEKGSAECLYLIVARSGFEPDALEAFRSDEIGDWDSDRASEFSDGWGQPIAFMRWAPGFASAIQGNTYADSAHDPLDPLKVSDPLDYALVPLVYSTGPDESDGLVAMNGWASAASLLSIRGLTVSNASNSSWNGRRAGDIDPSAPNDAADNITNHDLSRK